MINRRDFVKTLSATGLACYASDIVGELIAQTPEEYVCIATALAGDVPRLISLRQSMRQRMMSSPLLDLAGFVRELESALMKMSQAELE